ncbi:type II toxin-antitoxin system prevent-host-death family antitoxin [Thiobacillus sp.]|uniref:type II toxin-antitoxin system Phd/YefM family antitoxin n=1 Tax=Thiobacillus sp. TaxID=924 RepID=UPI0025EEACD5|nr:type II toxin-antitoxin system prevent-host-death family antitoxin [Thiobacillus sp.]
MKTLTVREAREGLSHPDQMFADADEVLVMNRGEPVARILPVTPATPARKLPSLKWLRDQSPYQEIPSEVLIREDRDARD